MSIGNLTPSSSNRGSTDSVQSADRQAASLNLDTSGRQARHDDGEVGFGIVY